MRVDISKNFVILLKMQRTFELDWSGAFYVDSHGSEALCNEFVGFLLSKPEENLPERIKVTVLTTPIKKGKKIHLLKQVTGRGYCGRGYKCWFYSTNETRFVHDISHCLTTVAQKVVQKIFPRTKPNEIKTVWVVAKSI